MAWMEEERTRGRPQEKGAAAFFFFVQGPHWARSGQHGAQYTAREMGRRQGPSRRERKRTSKKKTNGAPLLPPNLLTLSNSPPSAATRVVGKLPILGWVCER